MQTIQLLPSVTEAAFEALQAGYGGVPLIAGKSQGPTYFLEITGNPYANTIVWRRVRQPYIIGVNGGYRFVRDPENEDNGLGTTLVLEPPAFAFVDLSLSWPGAELISTVSTGNVWPLPATPQADDIWTGVAQVPNGVTRLTVQLDSEGTTGDHDVFVYRFENGDKTFLASGESLTNKETVTVLNPTPGWYGFTVITYADGQGGLPVNPTLGLTYGYS
ncbi:hypothetical protein [Deinococcus rufus]|uniref:Uncharacterized protein n=1 Tax=Deinococcus rufus TaxID=2136097 RepID=A0ABV7ZB47_9DEIO